MKRQQYFKILFCIIIVTCVVVSLANSRRNLPTIGLHKMHHGYHSLEIINHLYLAS